MMFLLYFWYLTKYKYKWLGFLVKKKKKYWKNRYEVLRGKGWIYVISFKNIYVWNPEKVTTKTSIVF